MGPHFFPATKKRFGVFGAKVVPAPVYVGGEVFALKAGAAIGRARPDLFEVALRSHSDAPNDRNRLAGQRRALAEASGELANRWTPAATFADLKFAEPPELAGIVDADEAIGLCCLDFLVGLCFGTAYPDITRAAITNDLADKQGHRRALSQAGLPDAGYRTYEEWERDMLAAVEAWEKRLEHGTK